MRQSSRSRRSSWRAACSRSSCRRCLRRGSPGPSWASPCRRHLQAVPPGVSTAVAKDIDRDDQGTAETGQPSGARQRARQPLGVVRPGVPAAVDEEGRRAARAAGLRARPRRRGRRASRASSSRSRRKLLGVEAAGRRRSRRGPRPRARPGGRTAGRASPRSGPGRRGLERAARGQLGVRVDVGQRQVAEDVAQVVAEPLPQLARPRRWPARRTGTRSRRTRPASAARRPARGRGRRPGRRRGRGSAAGRRRARRASPPASGRAASPATVGEHGARAGRRPRPGPAAPRRSKARSVISSETVKPMPDSAAPPSDVARSRRPAAAARARAGRAEQDRGADADELAERRGRRRCPR